MSKPMTSFEEQYPEQAREIERLKAELANIKSKLAPPDSGVYVGKGYTLADLHEDLVR